MEAVPLHSTSTPKQWNQADTTRLWQTVCSCVENYVAAWESTGVSPPMRDYLPQSVTAPRRLAAIELIKVDLEYRLERKLPTRPIEEYLAEFPELTEPGLPLDLIYEEYHLRVRHGEPVNPEEYLRRFPGNSVELRRMLYGDAPRLTRTSLATAPVTTIEVNGRIDDFDILAELGKGAFATVYLARQRSMQRIVALKVSADRGIEAQTLAQLDHPHIVRVYDQRSLPDRGLRLLYMQYIAGGTLQPVVDAVRDTRPVERSGHLLLRVIDGALDRRGESPPTDSLTRRRLAKSSWGETVCWIGARLASALEYAHGHGVLHRDVKPANVLIAADGTPKLVDFNIACCSKVEGATPAAYFGGSLTYMSPEQLEACNPSHERTPDELDGRSEVYSLGVLLWELVSGYRPFIDEEHLTNWPQLLSQMAAQRRAGVEQQATRHLPANLPSGLKEVLLRCLQPEPADRFASAGELARQLELCLRPSAQRLLMPRPGNWRQFVRRHPTTTLAAAAIMPNAVVSVLNATYNASKLISVLPQSAQDLFYSVQIVTVNGTMYLGALAICIWLCWPVLMSMRQTQPGVVDPDEEERVRERSLWMGDSIAYVVLGAWFVSGLIYPTWLALYSGPGQVGAEFFLHFVISQILCGVLSGTLAFFTVTFLAVRALYPALLSRDRQSDRDVHWINSLSQRVWRFLVLSVAVPLLAVAMVAFSAGQQWVFGAISVYGLVGFIASLGLARAIQDDLGVLSLAISPVGESLPGEAQGFESLVTESHRY